MFYQMLLLALQDPEIIRKKMEQAPDNGYEIGVIIGTYLPFVFFIIFAYAVYYFVKNKKD